MSVLTLHDEAEVLSRANATEWHAVGYSVCVAGKVATLFSIDFFSDVPERPKFYKERGQLSEMLPSWTKDTAVFLLV